MSMWKKNVLLIALAVLIAAVPLVMWGGNAAFEGADGQAEEAITKIDPGYKPWFSSLIELPSGEVESLLFCLQAAIGAGVMGFILGRMTARPKRGEKREEAEIHGKVSGHDRH